MGNLRVGGYSATRDMASRGEDGPVEPLPEGPPGTMLEREITPPEASSS